MPFADSPVTVASYYRYHQLALWNKIQRFDPSATLEEMDESGGYGSDKAFGRHKNSKNDPPMKDGAGKGNNGISKGNI